MCVQEQIVVGDDMNGEGDQWILQARLVVRGPSQDRIESMINK